MWFSQCFILILMLPLEPLLSCPVCVFQVIVMLEDPATTHPQCSYWVVRRLLPKMASSNLPSIWCSRAVPLAEKHPQSMISPPACFSRDGILGILLKHSEWSSDQKFYFGLFWPHDHRPCLLWIIQMLFGKFQTGLDMKQRNLCMLQNFNPWQCSLLMVSFEIVVPALFTLLTSSSRVVLGLSLTFLRIFETPWGEILHGAPVRGRFTEFLPFSDHCGYRCSLFTKLFSYFSVAHPSLTQGYNFAPGVLRKFFAHSGKVGVCSAWSSVWTRCLWHC